MGEYRETYQSRVVEDHKGGDGGDEMRRVFLEIDLFPFVFFCLKLQFAVCISRVYPTPKEREREVMMILLYEGFFFFEVGME